MSNAAIKWAMSQKAGDPTRKLILILLADFANSSAECWPSVATISQASEITARSVQRAIRGLETSGLIVAMPRSGNSTKYRLNVGATPDTSVTPDVGVTPDASVRGGATWVSGGGRRGCQGGGDVGVTQSLNNPHITPNEPKEDTAGKREIARQSIDLLNRVANRSFRHTEKNIGHVMARLREGFTPADIQLAVEHKSAEWGGDSHMAQYLRPETLFGTKFESYLQAATAKQSGVIRDEKPKTALERLQANIDAAESTFSGAVISRDDGAPMDGARPHLRLGAVDKKLW